ncbi:MAG: sensor histidine kinase [Oleispira sp.]|nr:sensor histidine kinase [Oleispira sp.]
MLRKWKISFIILVTFLLLSFFVHSENTQSLNVVELHRGEEVQLIQYGQILEDIKGELSWQQAQASNAWLDVETSDLNLGMSRSAYWFRVQIKYAEKQTRIFQIRYPLLDYVDFFLVKNNLLIKHIETGDSRPFNTRELKDKNFAISHYENTEQVLTLLIRTKTEGSMVLPLLTVNIEDYAQEISNENLIHGIYFGISVAMFLYNLMLFVYLKDRNYLYYCLFVFIVFLFALAYTGQGFYRFWPEYEGLNRYMIPVTSGTGLLAATLFLGSFLQLNNRGRWARKVFLICLLLSIFSVVASLFLSYSQSIQVLTLIQLLLTVLYLGTSSYLWKVGVLEAKYFTLAWVFFILGNSINSARVLGVLPSNTFTVYASLYGSAIEMIMLSMGLAYRFETMKEVQIELSRKLRLAQQSAIKNLEKYRDLFQQSPVGLFRYERDSDKFYNNDKSNALINNHEDIREFLQDELTFSDYKYLLENNGIKDKAIQYGDGKYYSLSLLVIRNDEGEVIEIEGSLLDVSEQKLAENLRLASEREKLSSLTQLVFGISHQFNTPLGVMITTEDMIKEYVSKILADIDDDRVDKEDLLDMLNMVKDAMVLSSENTKIMSTMLKDLRYSIHTRENLNLSEIKTITLFEDLLGYLKPQLADDACVLNIDVSTNGINTILSDYDVLSDVLVRLYRNSYSHGYTKDNREGLITIKLSQDDNYICIEYSDDGRGLSDAEQENIFVPFYTGNSRKKGNSGLGMYILHNQIVKILHGKVELQPSETGFAINIFLPK